MGKVVTDPELLALLNAPETPAPKKVTDPALLAQLNAPDAPAAPSYEQMLNSEGAAFKDFVREKVGSVVEPLATMVTGIPATLSGVGAKAVAQLSNLTGHTNIDADALKQQIQHDYTYEPRTESGRLVNKAIGYIPGKALEGVKKIPYVGEPLADTAEAAMAVLPFKGKAPAALPVDLAKLPAEVKPVEMARKNMSPEESRAADIKLLDDNNVFTTREERGLGGGAKQAASAGRFADALLGKSQATQKKLQSYTERVMELAGLKAKNATPDAMRELHTQWNGEYNRLHEKAVTPIDAELQADLKAIMDRTERSVPESERGPLELNIKDIYELSRVNEAGGPPALFGKAAQNLRQSLAELEAGTNKAVAGKARDIKDALDDAYMRHAAPEDAAAMSKVRLGWHRMKQIEDAVAGDASGLIKPARMNTVLSTKRNRSESVYGRGEQELVELTRAAKNVFGDKEPNSGTPGRSADIMKGVLIGGAHIGTAGTLAGLAGAGRLINEGSLKANTAAAKSANAAKSVAPPVSRTQLVTKPAALSKKESPEERKRRLQAEALRKGQE